MTAKDVVKDIASAWGAEPTLEQTRAAIAILEGFAIALAPKPESETKGEEGVISIERKPKVSAPMCPNPNCPKPEPLAFESRLFRAVNGMVTFMAWCTECRHPLPVFLVELSPAPRSLVADPRMLKH